MNINGLRKGASVFYFCGSWTKLMESWRKELLIVPNRTISHFKSSSPSSPSFSMSGAVSHSPNWPNRKLMFSRPLIGKLSELSIIQTAHYGLHAPSLLFRHFPFLTFQILKKIKIWYFYFIKIFLYFIHIYYNLAWLSHL